MSQVIETVAFAGFTFRQRWSQYFAILLLVGMLIAAFYLRNSLVNATTTYTNATVGITALYPKNWLLDEGTAEYVFRVRDMARQGYKTTLQVSINAAGTEVSARNIADRLALTRAQTFTDYTVLATNRYAFAEDLVGQEVLYTYVSRETNPFLQGIPQVVTGLDVIVLTRGQALILTFRAASTDFDTLRPLFDRFLRTLVF